jgi:hypothetical protein
MDLTPGERAVLRQLGELYTSTSRQWQPLEGVTTKWPPLHYDTYRGALASLLSKNLLQASSNQQTLRITDAGLIALGISIPILNPAAQAAKPAARETDHPVVQQEVTPVVPSPERTARLTEPREEPLMRIAVMIGVLVACVGSGWVLWRFVLH